MKKFLQGLLVIGCCTLLYFWGEGILSYSKTEKVPHVVMGHALSGDYTYLVINKGASNATVKVTVKDYVETRNGDLYYVEEKVAKEVWWKTILFEVIPILIIGFFVFVLVIGFLIMIS